MEHLGQLWFGFLIIPNPVSCGATPLAVQVMLNPCIFQLLYHRKVWGTYVSNTLMTIVWISWTYRGVPHCESQHHLPFHASCQIHTLIPWYNAVPNIFHFLLKWIPFGIEQVVRYNDFYGNFIGMGISSIFFVNIIWKWNWSILKAQWTKQHHAAIHWRKTLKLVPFFAWWPPYLTYCLVTSRWIIHYHIFFWYHPLLCPKMTHESNPTIYPSFLPIVLRFLFVYFVCVLREWIFWWYHPFMTPLN